jgi:UDP-N-acetylmuramoyl-tripeptide--D-alanyl-D-alanine ligase
VARAKGELFDALSPQDTAVVNLEDPWVKRLAGDCPARHITFGRGPEATVQAQTLDPFHAHGARFTLKVAERAWPIRLNCHGLPCIENALAAAASAWAMGAGGEQIVEGLESFRPFAMRFTVIPLDHGIHLIDDSYNANPVSVSAALEALCRLARGRTVAVLGDMLELGEETAEAHRSTGRRAGDLGLQVLIGVGAWAEALVRGARESATPPREIHTVDSTPEAAQIVLDACRAGDWILVKGSRRLAMERVADGLRQHHGPAEP